MMERWRGVNLGNWLVLERWMDPGMFAGTDAADETWLNRLLDPAVLARRLEAHRDTYVAEADFRWIAAMGCNFVRIPVPYFVFGDRSPAVGARGVSGSGTQGLRKRAEAFPRGGENMPQDVPGLIPYLDRAMDWAGKYGLKILLDLHTTPGGQNGYDNGGIQGVCRWHRDPEAREYVLTVLERLAARYGEREELFGIEVLNEPVSLPVYLTAPSTGTARDPAEAAGSGYVPMHFLKAFYREAYRRIRRYLPEEKAVVFHDGFRLPFWGAFFRRHHMKNVYLDTHIYLWAMEKFVPVHRPFAYYLYLSVERAKIRFAELWTPVLVGEWSLANRYAAKLSRHRTVRAFRHAGIPDRVRLAEERRRYREVCAMEQHAFAPAAGTCFWNYELLRDTDSPMNRFWKDGWDFRRCVKNGWIPRRDQKDDR
jgi:glucan 1,3-beta-glucosidase